MTRGTWFLQILTEFGFSRLTSNRELYGYKTKTRRKYNKSTSIAVITTDEKWLIGNSKWKKKKCSN